jgi:hypothetical protein
MGANAFNLRQLVVIAKVTHSLTISDNGFSAVLPNAYETFL